MGGTSPLSAAVRAVAQKDRCTQANTGTRALSQRCTLTRLPAQAAQGAPQVR
jgi:hypothetical protein